MPTKTHDLCATLLAGLLGLGIIAVPAAAQPLGSAFTYQGQLTESGQPAGGLYDLQVCLFDSPSNPVALACAPDFADVPVEAGVFTVALDFGAPTFAGQRRFLELRVRTGASVAGYTILSPRQLVRPTPEALRAATASAAPWTGLLGVPAGFADGIDNDSGGSVSSVIAGTGLSGGTIAGSGTIGIANGGVGSAQIADGGVAAVDIAPDSLGQAQIASSGVAAAELADNAVDTAALQDLAVTQAKIATGAVGSGQLAGSAVGPVQLAAGAVGLAQINTAQVQARIAGTCAIGEYFRGVNPNGSVACEPMPGVPRITTVDDPINRVGNSTAIAIGADGLPVISYHDDSAGALKVAKCTNAACTGAATISVVDDPVNRVGPWTSIAIGADGLPVISYQDIHAGALKVAKCANAACTGAATITTVDDDPVNNVGWHTSIDIGADALPVISYADITASTLKVAKCTNAACTGAATITIVDDPPANRVGSWTSIAIGADGFPVISYTDHTLDALKILKCANAACAGASTITIVDDPANFVGFYTSIAIGTDGLPVISYYDETAGALKVAKCANPACTGAATIITVDDPPANNVGIFTSIAIGADGLPVISYWDITVEALKVAKCTNAACTGAAAITTVDDPANLVGGSSSIAVGADGLPVISYRDTTAGALKVAKCGTRSCQ